MNALDLNDPIGFQYPLLELIVKTPKLHAPWSVDVAGQVSLFIDRSHTLRPQPSPLLLRLCRLLNEKVGVLVCEFRPYCGSAGPLFCYRQGTLFERLNVLMENQEYRYDTTSVYRDLAGKRMPYQEPVAATEWMSMIDFYAREDPPMTITYRGYHDFPAAETTDYAIIPLIEHSAEPVT